jgi:integrase/recombinase XerD
VKSPQSSTLALALHGFFVDYLPQQRALSPHTLQSYRDSLKLLLRFTAKERGKGSSLYFSSSHLIRTGSERNGA